MKLKQKKNKNYLRQKINYNIYVLELKSSKCSSQLVGLSWKVTPRSFKYDTRLMVTIGSGGGKVVLPLMSSYVATIPLKAFYDEALLKVPFKHRYYFQLVPAKRQCSCRVFTSRSHSLFKVRIFSKKIALSDTVCFGHRYGAICRYF